MHSIKNHAHMFRTKPKTTTSQLQLPRLVSNQNSKSFVISYFKNSTSHIDRSIMREKSMYQCPSILNDSFLLTKQLLTIIYTCSNRSNNEFMLLKSVKIWHTISSLIYLSKCSRTHCQILYKMNL